jgi:two-component system LytT family response regulator
MPDRLRAVIVDDESMARRELRAMLSVHSDVEVVGESAGVAAALRLVRSAGAHAVFLDIQLVGETGFAVIDHLPASCSVVFVTAYAEYAVHAFEVRACDYLLKPVEADRLAETLDRIRDAQVGHRSSGASTDCLFLRVIDARGEGRYRFLRIAEITCITAEGDYSRVAMIGGGEWVVGKSLREWEARLPSGQFARAHRSAIVNLAHVERVEEWSHYSYHVYIAQRERPVTLSRRYAVLLRDRLT